MHQFRRILDAYKRQTRDFSVDNVPWKALIGFRGDSIDFNNITPETLQFILPDIDNATLTQLTTGRSGIYKQFDDLALRPEDVAILKTFNVNFYTPKVLTRMHLFGDKKKVSYTFVYDLSKQKASDFALTY